MRRALPLILLLAACEPRRDPRNIERALSEKTIDVEALENLLSIEKGALRVVAPDIDPICASPPDGTWYLENTGRRPVWLHRSDLQVGVRFQPFLPAVQGGRCGGVHHNRAIARPAFIPEEWLLLEREARVPLRMNGTIREPGVYELSVLVWRRGDYLCHEAREFNSGSASNGPSIEFAATAGTKFLLLPDPDWKGAPWHETHSIDPIFVGNGRFRLTTDVDPGFVQPGALPLESFVVTAKNDCVWSGPFVVEHQEGEPEAGLFRNRTTYRLPASLEKGDYRILVRAKEAETHFSRSDHRCSGPMGAASRWIPFRVE
jgi:hypothetical protein